MTRAGWNALVDGIAFAIFVLLTSTGVLLRWTLPPGSGHHTRVLGLDRHEWGTLHAGTALALLAVLSLHLALHWRFVVQVLRGRRHDGSGRRFAIGLLALLGLLGLALAPLLAPVEQAPRGGGERPGAGRSFEAPAP